MSGAGQWIINNYTDYWGELKKSDLSSNYAVVAPKAKRVIVPVQIGETYDYTPHYFKELKYEGKVIGVADGYQEKEQDTVTTTETRTSFITNFGDLDANDPDRTLKPSFFFTNSSDKTVRVYVGSQKQLSATGVSGTDFAIASGDSQMFTSGIEAGISTRSINFGSVAWNPNKYVSQDIKMLDNKVYRIVLSKSGDGYSTTVEEQDASEYFE